MTNIPTEDEMVVELGRTTDRRTEVARIPTSVLNACRGEAWFYAHMSLLARGDTSVSLPMAQLAEQLGVSARTVQNALRELQKAGAVEVQRPRSEAGSMLPHLYILRVSPPAGDAE